jgi:ABC-type Zn uptake system ZnuABC Zn-binding protein ZnuA
MRWHQELSDFGPVDGDVTLLSKIVEKIILPLIIARIGTYDPYSFLQTTRAINLVSQISDYMSTKSPTVQDFFKSIKQYFTVVLEVLKRHSAFKLEDILVSTKRNPKGKQTWVLEQFKVN